MSNITIVSINHSQIVLQLPEEVYQIHPSIDRCAETLRVRDTERRIWKVTVSRAASRAYNNTPSINASVMFTFIDIASTAEVTYRSVRNYRTSIR